MRKGRILVVEDELRIAGLVCDNLEREGYTTVHAGDGEAALRAMQDGGIDLVLLDVMLPGPDGFEVCSRLREEGDHTPVLFLTARDLPPDRVAGLMAGGDDYLVKPFHREELLARIHALLRRHQWGPASPSDRVPVGGGWVDFRTAEACTAQGSAIALAEKELGVLKLLSRAQGASVSRNRILDEVWGRGTETTPRTVDNFILKLRKQFEPRPGKPKFLVTVRGKGYRLLQAEAN